MSVRALWVLTAEALAGHLRQDTFVSGVQPELVSASQSVEQSFRPKPSVNKIFNRKESIRKSSRPKGYVAVFLVGETFRDGGQNSRLTQTKASYGSQLLASKSQMENLVLPISSHGFNVLCFLWSAADRDHTQMLTQWYKPCLPPATRAQQLQLDDHTRHRDFFMALKMYKEYSTANSYSADYFIFLRPDMILKRNLFSDWDIAKGNIAFPFRASCNQTDHGCPADIPKKMCYRVPDRMIAMPRRAVEFIQRPEGHKVAIDFSHWTYIQLLNADDKWIRNHITFWLGEGHDADSAKEQNPIYTIAGRKEHSSRRDYACKGNP